MEKSVQRLHAVEQEMIDIPNTHLRATYLARPLPSSTPRIEPPRTHPHLRRYPSKPAYFEFYPSESTLPIFTPPTFTYLPQTRTNQTHHISLQYGSFSSNRSNPHAQQWRQDARPWIRHIRQRRQQRRNTQSRNPRVECWIPPSRLRLVLPKRRRSWIRNAGIPNCKPISEERGYLHRHESLEPSA